MYQNSLKNIRNLADSILESARGGQVYKASAPARDSIVARPEKEEAEETRVASYDPQAAILSHIAWNKEQTSLANLDAVTKGPTKNSSFTSGEVIFSGYDELKDLVDATEARGDYNALFGYSNREGKKFSHVRVTDMTLGELRDFSRGSGEYGQWVKSKNQGEVATPMGRYQFVGTTLFEVAKEMGLDDNTKFTPETQDHIFAYHVRDLLGRRTSLKGKRNILRSTWDGFKHVTDEQLNSAIRTFETSTTRIPQLRPES